MKAFSIHKPVVFLIITILGSLSAMLADAFGGWVLAAGFLAVSAMLLIGNLVQFGKDEIDPGLTTEMAGLVMFAVGAALIKGYTVPAIAVSGVVAVLLQWKQHLQKFVDKISGCDFKAIIQLAAAAPLGVLMGLRRSLISRNTHKKKLKMLTLNPSTHSVRQILTQFIDIYALPNPVIMLVDMPGVSKAEVAEFRDQTYTERTAHFGVRKYFQVVIFLIICLSVSGTSVAWGHNEKIDGYFFGDYYYLPKSHHGELEKRNGFQYRRVYFTYEKDLSTEFSTRFRLEMNGKSFPTARQTTSKLEPFLKHGYLKWKPSGWRTNIYLGLSGTPTWRNVEKAWGYRSVAKTVLDLHKMGSSTDFGIALQGDIDASNQISYHLMIANGTGTRAEIDKNKKISFSLAAKPIAGVTLEGYVDRENAADLGKWYTLQGFLGYQQERFRFGIQLANQTRQQGDVDTLNILASSVFGAVQLLEKKVWAFARFDRLFNPNPNAKTISYIPFDNTARSNMILVGLDWAPTEAVHIMPNLIFVFYDKPDNIDKPDETIMPRLTAFFKF